MSFPPPPKKKKNLEVFLCLNVQLESRDQKLKMKEIDELVAKLLCLDKQIGISERGLKYLTFYAWHERTPSLKLKL